MNSKDIREKQFKTKLSGYNPLEVDEFLDDVAEALDDLTERLAEKTETNRILGTQIDEYREMERALRESMVTAQKTSISITEEARRQAAKITESAQAAADKMLKDAKEQYRNVDAAEKKMHEIIDEYKNQIRNVMSRQLDVMEEYFSQIERGGK